MLNKEIYKLLILIFPQNFISVSNTYIHVGTTLILYIIINECTFLLIMNLILK
jgi:hypothetical protein